MQDQDIVLSDNEIQMLNALATRAIEAALPVEDLIEGGQENACGQKALSRIRLKYQTTIL